VSGAQTSALTYREVLRIAVMRRIWYAQVASLLGDWLAVYAIISVISFRLNGSAGQIAAVQIASMLPFVIFGPVAGVYVDRWPLKPVLIASDLIRAVLVSALFFTTSLWQIYVVLIAMSCASSFFVPAQAVTIRHYVPPDGLLAANALMQLAAVGTRVVGPDAAGALVAVAGAPVCYAIDVLSFVASAGLIASVAIHRTVAQKEGDDGHGKLLDAWHDLREGLGLIGRGTAAVAVFAMGFEMFMIGCFAPIVAPYVRDSLHGGPALFGVVIAMSSVGMVVGMQSVRSLTKYVTLERLVVFGLGALGGGVILLGALPTVGAIMAANFTIGCGFAVMMAAARTLLQQETPHALMGRVWSATVAVISLTQITGMLASGILAGVASPRAVFAVCGALAIGLAALGGTIVERRYRRMPDRGEPRRAWAASSGS
jgi:DHA3 family macrolide efflux protein-like MFS transporter